MALRGTFEYFDCWASVDATEMEAGTDTTPIVVAQTTTKKYTAAVEIDLTGGNDSGFRTSPSFKSGGVSDATYGRWLRIAARPSADAGMSMFGFFTHGMVGLYSDGTLTAIDGAGTVRANGTFAPTLNTWYWVTIRLRKWIAAANKADIVVEVYAASAGRQDSFSALGVPSTGGTFSTLHVGNAYGSTGNGAHFFLDGGLCVSGGADMLIAPDFWSDVPDGIGEDLVTNGGFGADTDWTKGTGWTIGGGTASSDGSQSADADLTQTISIVQNVLYEVTFTVSNYSAGNVTAVLGDTEGTDRAANGTFAQYILAGAGGDVDIRADLDFVGDIDDVIVTSPNKWTSSVPGDKWLDVDDVPPNDVTDYIFATIGSTQHFTYPASGLGSAPHVVGMLARTQRNGGVFTQCGHYLSGVTQTDTFAPPNLSYSWLPRFVTETKPGGGAWSVANLDSAETWVGSFLNAELRCTSMTKYAIYGGTYPAHIKKLSGVTWASVKKVSGVAEASISKVAGETAN
jgi:hypothetical protein